MLSSFATEIITEILLYLSYREFLRVIHLNRRLWSIAHHPRSPLRHRLRGRTSRIHLTLGVYGKIDLSVYINETIPDSTNKRCIERRLRYFCSNFVITDEPYIESEEDRSIILMEKSRIRLTYKTGVDLDDSKETYIYDKFSLDLSMRLAICHIDYVAAEYLTINKEFTLVIHNELFLNKFLLHFDAYDIRLANISFHAIRGKIDLPRLYESKLFQQKLYWLYFSSSCETTRNNLDFRHYEIHRNKLREVKSFIKYSNIPIKHNDDDLLLLNNIEYLRLCNEDEITGNGIARLIQKIYENKLGRRIYIEIDAKQKFTIEEVLKSVPGRKIKRTTKSSADFTNMFNEVFKIECLVRAEYTYFRLNSHDL